MGVGVGVGVGSQRGITTTNHSLVLSEIIGCQDVKWFLGKQMMLI